jgi:hypothetical protein
MFKPRIYQISGFSRLGVAKGDKQEASKIYSQMECIEEFILN